MFVKNERWTWKQKGVSSRTSTSHDFSDGVRDARRKQQIQSQSFYRPFWARLQHWTDTKPCCSCRFSLVGLCLRFVLCLAVNPSLRTLLDHKTVSSNLILLCLLSDDSVFKFRDTLSSSRIPSSQKKWNYLKHIEENLGSYTLCTERACLVSLWAVLIFQRSMKGRLDKSKCNSVWEESCIFFVRKIRERTYYMRESRNRCRKQERARQRMQGLLKADQQEKYNHTLQASGVCMWMNCPLICIHRHNEDSISGNLERGCFEPLNWIFRQQKPWSDRVKTTLETATIPERITETLLSLGEWTQPIKRLNWRTK